MNIHSLAPLIWPQTRQTVTTPIAQSQNSRSSMQQLSFRQMLERQLTNGVSMGQDQSINRQNAYPSIQARENIPSVFDTAARHNVNQQPSMAQTTDQPETYQAYITDAAGTYNVDPQLVHAIIKAESNYNEEATSRAGAQGLMQLMPATAKSLGMTNLKDPKQNIIAGTKYISQMLERYHGDKELALAAYNAGPTNVDKHQGIPPFEETEQYVDKVMTTYLA